MKVFDWIKFQGAGGPGEAADLPPPHSAEDGDGQPAATEVTILVLPTFSVSKLYQCSGSPFILLSVVEPKPAGAGLCSWSRFKSSGLLLCDLGVLWGQNCDNSYNFRKF